MDTKIKGVSFRSVYDEKEFLGEVNDLPSETVTTGYIPINEQVKMIMRGEITVGNWQYDVDDKQDIDEECPEDYFEDATDYNTESELKELYEAETSQNATGNTATQQYDGNKNSNAAAASEERAKQSDEQAVAALE